MSAILFHADRTTEVVTETQGEDDYPVLNIHTAGMSLALFGPVAREGTARLAFAQALADAAAVFLAAEQRYSGQVSPACDLA